MIITLFIVGFAAIVFGIYNIAKKKNLFAVFFLFMGITLIAIGYIVVHIYSQTLPDKQFYKHMEGNINYYRYCNLRILYIQILPISRRTRHTQTTLAQKIRP